LILIKSSQADLKSIQAETKPNQAGLIWLDKLLVDIEFTIKKVW
jgi:hypothetical protein